MRFLPGKKICLCFTVTFALACLAGIPLGCKPHPASEANIDSFAREYLRLAVALGERDSDSLDFYFGPEALVREVRDDPPKLDLIRQQAVTLSEQVRKFRNRTAENSGRANFLVAQLAAIALRAQLLSGRNPQFDTESLTFFHVKAADASAASRAHTRVELTSILGRETSLSRAYTAFDARFQVSPERLPAVMEEALRQCRAQTLRYIVLPAGERVNVEYVFHKPWSAFSRYLGHAHSVIQVNMDFPLTVDRVLNLACHEGYPGHHVFNTLRDRSLVQSMQRDEWFVQPTFSPQSFVSEAAASYAPDLAFRPEERLHIERDFLFPLAGVSPRDAKRYLHVQRLVESLHTAEPAVAKDYLDGRLEFVRAADALQRETLMEHPETMLLYFNEYRSYMLTYTEGRDRVQSLIEHDHPTEQDRWHRYHQLMIGPVFSLCAP
jgi:hypothetical protein